MNDDLASAADTATDSGPGSKAWPIAFDHDSPAHARDWPGAYRELRETCPMAFSSAHGGFWVPTTHRDVLKIAQDTATFRSGKQFDPETMEASGGAQIPAVPMPRMIPVETDAPDWNVYRGLLNPLFTPRVAATRRAATERIATALLDQVIEAGHCDIAQDFNRPVPAVLTMEMFGLPVRDWRTFSGHIHNLFAYPKTEPGYAEKAGAGVAWILRRLTEEVADRKRALRDDIISHLVAARVEGEPLDDDTIRIMCFNVIIGGVDTVNALTSNVIVHLWENKAERRLLAAKPDMIPTAMEEFVRYFSPSHALARTASRDVEIRGQQLSAGDRVLLPYAAANRDPAVFDRPDDVVLGRSPNRHVGFGAGPHHCLGAHQARITFPVMLREILTRIPDYEVDIDAARRTESVASVNGWVNIPIRFAPGARRGDRHMDL